MFENLMQLLPVNMDKLEKNKDVSMLKKILVTYKDNDKRVKAAYALGRITGDLAPKAEGILVAFAQDESFDERLRCHCILSLGKQKTEGSEEALIEFLRSPSDEICSEAIRALSDFESGRSACAVGEALGKPSAKVQEAASDYFGTNAQVGKSMREALYNENEAARAKAGKEINALKSRKILDFLLKILAGGSDQLKKRAAAVLGCIDSDVVVAPLTAMLEKEKGDVLAAVYSALGKLKTDKTVDVLLKGLDNESFAVRTSCIYALCDKKSEKAVPRLLDILSDSDAEMDVRILIAKSLGKVKSLDAMNAMISNLKTAPDALRTKIEDSLVEMNHDSLPEGIAPLLENGSDKERLSAVKILTRIRRPGVSPILLSALNDRLPELRNLLIIGLGDFKEPEVADALLGLASDPSQPSQLRGQAVRSVGNIANVDSLYPLFDLIKDKDEHVRGSAAFALGNFKRQEVVEVLGSALLNDTSDFVRSMAVESLGQMKDPNTLEYLKKAKNDPSDKVKNAVARVLRNM